MVQGNKVALRESVIQAALRSFEEQGFKNTSLESVAADVDVDIAEVKELFGNKDLLILAVQSWEIEKLKQEYFANMPDGCVVEGIKFILKTRCEFIGRNQERTMLVFRNAFMGRQPWSKALDQMVFNLSVEFAALLEKSIREGCIRKDVDVNIVVRAITSFYLTGIVSMGLRAETFEADVVWAFIEPQIDLLMKQLVV